jgi:membrane protease YdiL (CAAX protease family)
VNTPRRIIGRQWAVFIIVAYATSWTLWLWAPFVAAPGGADTLDALATFGPAVAAVIVILLLPVPGAPAVPRRPGRVIRMLVPSAVLTVSILVLARRWDETTTLVGATLLGILTLTPSGLAWLSTSRASSRRGLLGSLTAPRSAWWTYVVALTAFPVLSIAGTALVVALGASAGPPPQVLGDTWTGVALVFAATLLYGGPLGEEIGWRGWALPALQARFSPLVASLFVGLLWGMWHLPLHLRGVYDAAMGPGLAGFGLRIASSCLLAVVFTWLYNRSRGGLLVVILLHTSVNNTSGYWLPVNTGLTAVLLITAAVLVVVDRMWLRRPQGPSTLAGQSGGRLAGS